MSNLTTPPRAIFRQIQANLKDRYSSGFPVLKELIQNAEDAGASLIRFVAHPGWQQASNPLLRVPGLLVANTGRFESKDGRGILSFADSAKGDETASIGRFGFGQKAVFHLCDAFIAHAFGQVHPFSEVINPCLGVIEETRAASWDSIGAEDIGLLEAEANDLDRGFLLWIPLRRNDILPAPKLAFMDTRPQLSDLINDLVGNRSELHLTLAGLRNVDKIEVWQDGLTILCLTRAGDAKRMTGPSEGAQSDIRGFAGTISETGARTSKYVGREAYGSNVRLDALYDSDAWPQVPVFTEHGEDIRREKAAVHAAVVLTDCTDEGSRATLVDWAVFLPVASAVRLPTERAVIRLMLHGYFFVDSGRRYIEGFEAGAEPNGSVLREWNAALRDEVLLPLVPTVLFDGFQSQMFTSDDLATLLQALKASEFGRSNGKALASRQSLVRAIEPTGKGTSARWRLVPASAYLRPFPAPDARGTIASVDLFPGLLTWAERTKLTLIAGPDAALVTTEIKWQPKEICELLSTLSPSAFQQGGRAGAVADFLQVAVGKDDQLRQAAAGQLFSTLRETLRRKESLANEDQFRAVLAYLPPGSAIALPKSAGAPREILRVLATVTDAPICLRVEWLTDDVARSEIEPAEAARLLSALNPLLRSHTNSEAAGTAALALVKLLGTRLAALMDDPEIAKLEIMRANDGSGNAQLVSLVDLAAAAQDRRLFRDNPNVQRMLKSLHDAAPGCGVLTVGGDAAALLAEIGAPFAFADASKESFARLILRAANFGSVEARAKYMSDHFSLAPEVRSAFRRMAAGRDCGVSAKLVALPQGMGPLSDLAAKLIAQENGSFLISHEIVDVLKAGERRHLGIHEIDGLALGLLLRNNAAVLGDQTVGRDLIVALLRSDIPDGDLLVLPIFPAKNGDLHCAAQVWRETKQFSVPKILTPVVPILQKLQDPLADERMNRLVGVWSPEAQISVALSHSAPENFTGEILDALNKVESTLPERSRTVEWLTDRQGRNWAPEDVLDLPKGVLSAARKLYGLEADAAFVPVDELTEELSTEKALGAMRRNRILPDLAGSIERLLMLIEDNSPVAWAGATGSGVADNLLQLARSGADLCLPGWPLLSELLRMPEMLPERILPAFGTIQPDEGDHALAWMTSLADLAKAGNGPAWEIYCASFETFCAWPNKASKPLFRDIPVPTEAETWRPGREVARGGNGLAKTHLLHRSLRSKLPRRTDVLASVSEDSQAPHGQPFVSIDPVRMERQSAESLRSILEYARPHVPADLLVLLVRLVGQSDPFRVVAKDVLAVSEADIARIWSRFDSEVVLHFKPQKLGETLAEKRKSRFINFVSVCNSPTTAIAETLDGEIKDFPVGDIQPLGIIGDIHIGWQNIWQGKNLIGVRDLQIVTVADQVVKPEQVKALCLTLATVLIGYRKEQPGCHESLGGLADACNRIDQSTVDSARAELEDRLPQVLDELKPKQGSGMWNARKTYRAAVDSIPFGEQREKSRPGAKRTLWQAVCKTEVQKEMLGAIRSRIDDFGYRPTRILFELFQNADDATQQHPGTGPGRFSVAFVDGRLVTRHWGRLINHPGPDPQEGERQGWRSDLFNMLVMNLSEKREDVTGRFGLGFKSVHLIADEVGIASHFVACKVRGGMLPDIWDAGRQVSVESSVDGRPATVIDLHIDPDRHPHAIEAVSAFRAVSGWLPAMSRSIRCIEIEGQGRWLADSPISLNDGVSLVKFAGREPGYALALDLGQETTIFLPLGAHGPVPADEKLPRLWLLAPLDETLTSGWLLNSRQFPVDPGRGRLKGSAEALQSMFARFGVVLGQRLVSLNDMVARDWQSFSVAAGIGNLDAETGYAGFLRALCDLFERDFADPLACHLHGIDRGLGRLFSERPALATGLPLPFDPFLQVGSVKLELKGALADRKVLVALKDWQMIQTVGKCSVGTEAAQRLERLGFARPKPFGFVDALRHEVGPDKRITPELADRLGAVLTDDLLTEIEKDEESAILELLSTSLFQLADGTWRTAALPPSQAKDSDEEERLLLAFAPEKCRAVNNYDGKGLAIYRLSMRQSGFQRSASDFAKWAESMDNEVQQRALLHYVLEGRQGATLGSILAKKRPFWIHAQSDEMRVSPIVADFSDEEMPKLLGLLYPEEQRLRWSEDFGTLVPIDMNQPFDLDVADAERFLKRLHGWWERDHKAERNRYEQTAYPEGFHPRSLIGKDAEAEREAWFIFFALAIFRTLGRSHDGAHRNFIAAARSAGWWQEMALASLPANPEPWLRRLEDFARPEAWRIDYPQWRRALADLYVLARWLPDYVDAYRNLPAIIRQRGPIALSDSWRLSASPIWQRRGLEGAPLSQSLGLGANWMIREGLRAGVWPDQDASLMVSHGWAASGRLRRVFRAHLGQDLGETANMDLSLKVFEIVKESLGPLATFMGDLDMPLQIVADGSHAEVLNEIVGYAATSDASDDGDYDAMEYSE